MRNLLQFIFIGFLSAVSGTARADLVPDLKSVVIKRNGIENKVSVDQQIIIAIYAQRLISSCSVEGPVDVSSTAGWDKAQRTENAISVKYQQTFGIVTHRGEYRLDEIFIPLPSNAWPAFVFVRLGNEVHALAKYSPEATANLVCNDIVGFGSREFNKSICHDWAPRI